ncbi:MAG: cob(I)yrinic acid a,c-diamide adenosyltransferase [Parashewanella sp.]
MTNDKQQKHQQRQQKLKQQVDARIEAATVEKGLLLILTGNGKGKSTSGFGTIARAVGHGKKAAVIQFIKGDWACGERNLLEQVGVPFHVMGTGFTWETQDREQDIAAAKNAWRVAKQYLTDPNIDCVLLDELTYMISYHYLDIEDVVDAIRARPPMQNVIVTGRACHRQLIELADTVSEVKSIKHAFDSGVMAQKGFDY